MRDEGPNTHSSTPSVFDREMAGRRRRPRRPMHARLAGVLGSAALAALMGGLLVGMAGPRVIEDGILAPHEGVIARLATGRRVSVAELAAAGIALKRALAVRESGPAWTVLGAVQLERARRIDPQEAGHAVFLDRGIAALERGLAIAPVQPSAWTILAEALMARHGPSPEVTLPLRMAFLAGRVGPSLVMRRIEVALTAWPELDPDSRALVAEHIRIAVDQAPADLADLARRRYLLRPIRGILARDPTRLSRFDAVYLSAG